MGDRICCHNHISSAHQCIKELIYVSDSVLCSIFRNLRRATTQRKRNCVSLGKTTTTPCSTVNFNRTTFGIPAIFSCYQTATLCPSFFLIQVENDFKNAICWFAKLHKVGCDPFNFSFHYHWKVTGFQNASFSLACKKEPLNKAGSFSADS